MEAVPKLPLISFELKTSPDNAHFAPKLKHYISEAYREDPEGYSNELHQLEGLRAAAIRPSIDTEGLSALTRYFCQLRAMQSRFPMAKGQPAACTFVWKDLYANMSCSLADIRFEMACILYNVGALLTQLGASEPRNSADSLKAACTQYQNAAWVFQYLREQFPQPQGVDVSTEIMRMLQEICFAQAQECILEKSIQDTKKASVVGAVATQVQYFYKNSMSLLGPSTGTDNIHEIIGTKLYNYWYRYLSFKGSYIGCIVCLYQGMNAEEQQKMGERVAFYQSAVDKLNEARKLAKYIEPVQVTQDALTFTNDVVEGKRKAAKNENEFIYHEEVPDKDLLVDLKPVCLVKAMALNFDDPEVSGPDLFSRLVPMGAHEASSMYSEEKAKLLRQIVSRADDKTQELTDFMCSIQLDQLNILDSKEKIPQEIVDRCAAMNAKADIIQTLVDSMNNLAEIISDVEHSLDDVNNYIQEETQKEKEFQKIMGPRPPSIVQTELSREFHKYQEAHNRTNESNQVLHKAMTLHIANLKLLAQPLDVLQSKIPSVENIEGLDLEAMQEMRRVVNKAADMQVQRNALLQELRRDVADDDVTARLLASSEPAQDIFAKELEKHTPKLKIIEQNLAAQENIINRLTSIYASYGESRRMLTDVLRKREALVNALITSYDTYEELLGKSQKGLEFYKKLAHNVRQLGARVKSTCQVQREERQQLLGTHAGKASNAAAPSAVSKTSEPSIHQPVLADNPTPKLKDYLPYMKNKNQRIIAPHVDPIIPAETYYPESIYPTSIRPAPVGSEATDLNQMKMPDGVVTPQVLPNQQIPYSRYNTPYATETDPYSAQYGYPGASIPYDKPEEANYGYNTAYTPPQYSQMSINNNQIYSNPQYASTQDNTTAVTDSPVQHYSQIGQAHANPNTSQYNVYNNPYMNPNQMTPIPESSAPTSMYNAVNQDLSSNFAQMQVNVPKNETKYDPPANFNQDYSHTYYSVQYPQASTPNMATYSNAGQNAPTNSVQSPVNPEYPSMNYPQNTENYPSQYMQNTNPNVSNPYSMPDNQYSYASSAYDNISQGYPIYTNPESASTYSTSVANVTPSVGQPYLSMADEANVKPAGLPPINEFDDKPIKSHVTGEALSTMAYSYQNFGNNSMPYMNPVEQNFQQPQSQQPTGAYGYDQTNVNYAQISQNHPGYTYNSATGTYDYTYGSQNSYSNYSTQMNDPQMANNQQNTTGVYTSAGTYETLQSPSAENSTMSHTSMTPQNQTYYNPPYGYPTQQSDVVSHPQPEPNNYVANVNQSTYVQPAQVQDTSVNYTVNQVATPIETVTEPPNVHQNHTVNVDNETVSKVENVPNDVAEPVEPQETVVQEPAPKLETKEEPKTVPSAFDLLSDIDFTVEQKPLMPEIKVPQISETAVKPFKLESQSVPIPKPIPKEESIERPAKRELFTDPTLLNRFTQEVKNLQKLVDSLTEKTSSGITVLDSKWKMFQDIQTQTNMSKSKSIATQHSGNIVTEVVPYDESRVRLKSDPEAYINASYYKQLTPWCIPLVISKVPTDNEISIFWMAILENKISCIVCLQSEIEMQGEFYWPTAKGQTLELANDLKVSLDEVNCAVHWTERRLTLSCGATTAHVSHFQISVFPAKVVCSPLVLLVDKILSHTYENRASNQLRGAWVQCGAGAGRSALVALLAAALCEVRAGYLDLCGMLDAGCANLYKHRSNVLEDTKYLADAYRAVLFYAQGVLCSGSTNFSGEAVSCAPPPSPAALPAAAPPPGVTSQVAPPPTLRQKFSRESFEEMKQSPGLKTGDMKDPLNFLDPLWSLKKK